VVAFLAAIATGMGIVTGVVTVWAWPGDIQADLANTALFRSRLQSAINFCRHSHFDYAQSAVDQALEISPNNIDAISLRSKIFLAQGEIGEGITSQSDVVALRGTWQDHYIRSYLFYSADLYSDAATAAAESLAACDSKDPLLLAHLMDVWAGCLSLAGDAVASYQVWATQSVNDEPDIQGWVFGDFVECPVQLSSDQIGIISVDKQRIRSGPSARYRPLVSLAKGTILAIEDEEEGWYFVSVLQLGQRRVEYERSDLWSFGID